MVFGGQKKERVNGISGEMDNNAKSNKKCLNKKKRGNK